MILIAAMGANRVIGRGSGMPWNVPEEYARFRATVAGHAVIMGRRSWEIFGADLADSHNVVISRSVERVEGAIVAADVPGAIARASEFGREVFSAGGASIYAATLPLAESMQLSTIKGSFEGDAYFPAFDPTDWQVVRREDHPAFEFVEYRRAGVRSDVAAGQ